MLSNPWLALIATFALSLLWLRVCDFAAHRGWIGSALSRKIIHIGTGPLFVLCWLLFPPAPESRFLAALVPLGITLQFALVGLGIMRDPDSVKAMSRSGDRREILRGPLYYGIVFVVLTVLFWKDSPVGMVALMILCGGDGLADIVGKRVASAKLPWSRRKSAAGSISVFFGGWALSVAILAIYIAAGVFQGRLVGYLPAVTVIALASMAVESLPLSDLDNITVPLTAVLLGLILF